MGGIILSGAVWQRSFEAFAGPGIHRPSDMMLVSEVEAGAILASLAAVQWQAAVAIRPGYTARHALGRSCTALFCASAIVGFYAGSYLWINRAHRARGLSTPLILAAASQRGGRILPAGIVHQGYTPAGLAAHRSAYRHAVRTALAAGLPVPAAVREESCLDAAAIRRSA